MGRLRVLITAGWSLAVLLVLLGPLYPSVGATPTERYVTTSGSGSACTQVAPCALSTALTQSNDGDSIYVASGVYTGSGGALLLVSRSITLFGGWDATTKTPAVRDPIAYPVTLDGQGQRRVVYITGAVTPTLDGFIITGGSAGEGAGIVAYSGASPIIRNNVIVSNAANAGWGGGIQIDSGGIAWIEHNRILSNSTPFQGGGLAAAFGSRPVLKNNLITGNSAEVRGAGVRLRDVNAVLVNNTIAHNTGAGGDGVYASSGSSASSFTLITLTNNIIVSNQYGLRVEGEGGPGVTVTIDYNDVWGNAAANYSGWPDATGSGGNFSADPLFVPGFAAGYALSQLAAGQAADSPAVDAGSDTALNLDLAGRTTRSDGAPDTGIVDLGYHAPLPRRVYLPVVLKSP